MFNSFQFRKDAAKSVPHIQLKMQQVSWKNVLLPPLVSWSVHCCCVPQVAEKRVKLRVQTPKCVIPRWKVEGWTITGKTSTLQLQLTEDNIPCWHAYSTVLSFCAIAPVRKHYLRKVRERNIHTVDCPFCREHHYKSFTDYFKRLDTLHYKTQRQ